MRVVIAGGGTAGHVNPALALAGAMEAAVTFIGTERGAEATLIPRAGFPFETISVRGWDRAKPATLVSAGLRATRAIGEAKRTLRRLAPDVVVGMGGYVSLPVCLAARLERVPIVLHEQNIVLGLAQRVCKPVARKLGVSFEETLAQAGPKGVLVGNPVPRSIATFDRAAERARGLERFGLDAARKTLLVFGGSQGAQRINHAATGLVELWSNRSDLQVVHIVGSRQAGDALPLDRGPDGPIYRAVPFVERMAEAYAVADLALCRGGATTIAEVTAVGLPAIVVPYPWHRDRQQERHGLVLAKAGAALVLPDPETTAARVAHEAERLLGDDAALAAMGRAARSCARPDAAAALARLVREVAA